MFNPCRAMISLMPRAVQCSGRPRQRCVIMIAIVSAAVVMVDVPPLACGQHPIAGPVRRDDETEDQFLEGLRQRRLFALAETYCRERLGAQGLSPRRRNELTIQWIRMIADQALNVPADQRDAYWKKARRVAEEYVRKYPEDPRTVLVQLQDAFTLVAQAEVARLEADLVAAASVRVDRIRTTIREACRTLKDLDQQLASTATSDGPVGQAFSLSERLAVRTQLGLNWARALRNLALTYADDSSDRRAVLGEASDRLEQLERQLPPDDPLTYQVRLERAVCCRLAGDMPRAAELLAGVPDNKLPPLPAMRALAEKIRGALARQQLSEALAMIREATESSAGVSPEFDLAIVETYVTLWRQTRQQNRPEESVRWREQALAAVKQIEARHGMYWGRRAELLLLEAGRSLGAGSAEILERTANEMYLQNRWDEALAGYDQAAQAARQTGSPELAFRLGYKGALLQQERQDHSDAARRFRTLALEFSALPDAPKAHLLAVVNLAQQAARDSSLRETYLAWLEEHVSRWPDSATADQARLWLGRFHQSRQQWDRAIVAYRGVDSESDVFGEAVQGMIASWGRWLESLQGRGEDLAQVREDAVSTLRRLGGQESEGEQKNIGWQCRLAAARFQLVYGDADTAVLKDLQQLAAQPTPWTDRVKLLYAWALAETGGVGGAQQALAATQQLSSLELSARLEVVQGLSRLLKSTSDPSHATQLLSVVQTIVEPLKEQANDLHEDARRKVIETVSSALLAGGDVHGALAWLEDGIGRFPEDLALQMSFGKALLQDDRPESWRRGLEQWRRIAARVKPRSDPWFEAKYHVALSQIRLGEYAEASRRIRYLQVTEDLAGSGWQSKFDALLRQCEARSSGRER